MSSACHLNSMLNQVEIEIVVRSTGSHKVPGYVDPVVARKRTQIFSKAYAASANSLRTGAQSDLILIYVFRWGGA